MTRCEESHHQNALLHSDYYRPKQQKYNLLLYKNEVRLKEGPVNSTSVGLRRRAIISEFNGIYFQIIQELNDRNLHKNSVCKTESHWLL